MGAAVFGIGGLVYDKNLTCKACGAAFDFTARDQRFYAEKGFENEPQRCRACRAARKNGRGHAPRPGHDVTCARCNAATTVPFKPRGDRPVYCRACFTAEPAAVGGAG